MNISFLLFSFFTDCDVLLRLITLPGYWGRHLSLTMPTTPPTAFNLGFPASRLSTSFGSDGETGVSYYNGICGAVTEQTVWSVSDGQML